MLALRIFDGASSRTFPSSTNNVAVNGESSLKNILFRPASRSRLLLAFAPEHIQEQVLNSPLGQVTPSTITDPKRLALSLKKIRKSGYSEAISELGEDLVSVSAPIFDHGGSIVAALGVVMPLARYEKQRPQKIRQLVSEAAAQASHNIGYAVGEDKNKGSD